MCIRDRVEEILSDTEKIQYYASIYFNHDSVFYIGRNIDYAVGLEGSLKLKEISYIHSEAYAAGELKHGTISVSYTHLDVYKRQPRRRSSPCCTSCGSVCPVWCCAPP